MPASIGGQRRRSRRESGQKCLEWRAREFDKRRGTAFISRFDCAITRCLHSGRRARRNCWRLESVVPLNWRPETMTPQDGSMLAARSFEHGWRQGLRNPLGLATTRARRSGDCRLGGGRQKSASKRLLSAEWEVNLAIGRSLGPLGNSEREGQRRHQEETRLEPTKLWRPRWTERGAQTPECAGMGRRISEVPGGATVL